MRSSDLEWVLAARRCSGSVSCSGQLSGDGRQKVLIAHRLGDVAVAPRGADALLRSGMGTGCSAMLGLSFMLGPAEWRWSPESPDSASAWRCSRRTPRLECAPPIWNGYWLLGDARAQFHARAS